MVMLTIFHRNIFFYFLFILFVLQDYSVKMVDEENNIIQSKFLQNVKNLNIHRQSDSANQTKTESPPFFDLNLDNTLFPAPDWVVPPPSDFCQDTNSQTFNNHTLNVFQTPQPYEIREQEAVICQPLNENVVTNLLHSTPANQNTESPTLSNQRDNHVQFILSSQGEASTSPTLQSNDTNAFQNMNMARFFETSTTDNLFHSLPTQMGSQNGIREIVARTVAAPSTSSSPIGNLVRFSFENFCNKYTGFFSCATAKNAIFYSYRTTKDVLLYLHLAVKPLRMLSVTLTHPCCRYSVLLCFPFFYSSLFSILFFME